MIEENNGHVIDKIVSDRSKSIDLALVLSTLNIFADQIDGILLASDTVNSTMIKAVNQNGYDGNIYTSRYDNSLE